MEREALMPVKPRSDLGMFVRSVIVEDDMHGLVARHGGIDRIEEADELLVAVLLHVAPDHGSVEDVERGEQRSRAVALLIMGHGAKPSFFERQPRLGAIKCLYLALLIE